MKISEKNERDLVTHNTLVDVGGAYYERFYNHEYEKVDTI